MKREIHAQAALRISAMVNVLLVLMIAAACLWKFTDLRLLLGGGYSYDKNLQYEAQVYQARELSGIGSADVVMLGDSLTRRGLWDEMLPRMNVVNRGIEGDVAEGVLARLDTVVTLHPSKLFLMIGTNDIGHKKSVADTASTVEAVIDNLHSKLPDAEIYLLSVLPRADYSQEVRDLNALYLELCESRDWTGYVDLYPLYCKEDGEFSPELYAGDGLHLSGRGYEVWHDAIMCYLENRA